MTCLNRGAAGGGGEIKGAGNRTFIIQEVGTFIP